jgi:dTDP-4-dehydrorhamnose 3,5-epimerase
MIFTTTRLAGAYLIDLEKVEDERGFFARTWCRREFEAHGLAPPPSQMNLSFTSARGTIRGLHYQAAPCAETKLICCLSGSIYDVIVDLRADSPTFREWLAVNLTAAEHRMLYVPEGFAHGFQSLEDGVQLLYLVSQFYSPDHERGVRYDDPAFAIQWPLEIRVISEKDRRWPDFVS